MKKVLFIYHKGNTGAGVWNVSNLLAEQFLNNDFEIHFLVLREYDRQIAPSFDERIHFHVINPKTKWSVARGSEILKHLRKFSFAQAWESYRMYRKDHKALLYDFSCCKVKIEEIDPDYIITGHYEQLLGIPDSYLSKTINVQHTSFDYAQSIKNNLKIYDRLKDKIGKFVWLSKASTKAAIDYGYKNSMTIYNAVRFKSKKVADVTKNKRLIAICRFNPLKRIDLMVSIADEVLKSHPDWRFCLYGSGDIDEDTQKIIKSNPQIKLMGQTNDPKKELLKASINLNTSSVEGFSLSILEANECGVPTISFDIGESVEEEILDNRTGIIVYNDNKEEYIKRLTQMMDQEKKLLKLAKGAKKYNEQFQIENIISIWLNLFKKIDQGKK